MAGMALTLWSIAGLLVSPAAVEYIDLDSGWTHEMRGPWQGRIDHRGLLALHHPWEPSETGNFAMVWKDVPLPSDWQGAIELAFYQNDDYHTSPDDPGGAALAAEGFVGHRRKQILIDNEPVWNMDVSDPVRPGESPHVRIPLNLAPEKRSIRIALVAFDNESSRTVLRGDYYRPSRAGLTRESDPDAARFRTTIFWGDLAFVQGDPALKPRPSPAERAVAARHGSMWPPQTREGQWRGKNIALKVIAPPTLPATGFPLEMGIPLPAGVAVNPDEIRLRAGGKAIFSQKAEASYWPDDSLRWVDCYFPLRPGLSEVSLGFAPDKAPAPPRIAIQEEQETSLRVAASPISWTTAQGPPLIDITHGDKQMIEALRLNLEVAGETIPGTNERCEILENGPGRCRAVLEGRFDGASAPFGRYALYVTSYRDLPYLKLWLRYINDTAGGLNVAHLRMDVDLASNPGGVNLPHGELAGDFSVNYAATAPQDDATAQRLDAPLFVGWDGGALAVKHARERLPKGVSRSFNTLSLDLCAGGGRPETITPGEAMSHEVWLALGKVDGAELAATVEQPPVLVNPAYWCDTGAFGPAAPLQTEHPFAEHLRTRYADKSWTELGQSLGVRHFPDSPYLNRTDAWSNDYDGRSHGLWQLWAMTGDRAWFDRASAVSAHVMDVAIVHSDPPGRDWRGAIHGPGPNHVAGPWLPALQSEGVALFGHWTGNPAAPGAVTDMAEFTLRTGAGLRGVTLRHFAGPFSTVYTAYRETAEVALLEAGTARIEAMLGRVDRRRGVWSDWHGSESYPGTSPWMAAQLALPLLGWYELTGDLEAAHLLVGLADAVLCEQTPWEGSGGTRTYSPNPRFPETRLYDPYVVPLLLAAHELSGDDFFRQGAESLWARWVEQPEFLPVFNLSAHWPWTSQLAITGR